MTLRMILFLHRVLHHRGHRLISEPCWVNDWLWRRLESDPRFVEAMQRGIEDIEAGRFVKWADIRREK